MTWPLKPPIHLLVIFELSLMEVVLKRTFQPRNIIRKRRHGFLARMQTPGGRKVIANRRAKGRARLSA